MKEFKNFDQNMSSAAKIVLKLLLISMPASQLGQKNSAIIIQYNSEFQYQRKWRISMLLNPFYSLLKYIYFDGLFSKLIEL